MLITDLIPWKRVPVKREEREIAPRLSQDDWPEGMSRLFDTFLGRGAFGSLTPFGGSDEGWGTFYPQVDVEETDEEIRISAELPGIDKKDIDVFVSHNVLTIRGEKKSERETQGKNYAYAERSYGSFQRSISLPARVQEEDAQAKFDKGVLTITLPKTAPAQSPTKIEVKVR